MEENRKKQTEKFAIKGLGYSILALLILTLIISIS